MTTRAAGLLSVAVLLGLLLLVRFRDPGTTDADRRLVAVLLEGDTDCNDTGR